MKSMNLERMKFFRPKDVEKLASYHLRLFIDRVFFKGKDKDNKSFGGYKSRQYKEMKSRGFVRKDGKGKYKAYKGQPVASTQTDRVDLKATGRLWRATHAYDYNNSDHYRIGWHNERGQDSENSKIVEGQKNQGRDILGIPSGEMEKVVRELGDLTEKQFKTVVKDINITVG